MSTTHVIGNWRLVTNAEVWENLQGLKLRQIMFFVYMYNPIHDTFFKLGIILGTFFLIKTVFIKICNKHVKEKALYN